MVVGARLAGLSISQSAQLLGFTHTTISRVYKEHSVSGSPVQNARGQRRMGRLIQADRRATLTEITTRYNRGIRWSQNLAQTEREHGSIMPCNCADWWWWCNGVGDVFLAHFRSLRANWASFKCHCLPKHCFGPCPPLYPSSNGYFQQDNAPCHAARIISNWFIEHDNEFTVHDNEFTVPWRCITNPQISINCKMLSHIDMGQHF